MLKVNNFNKVAKESLDQWISFLKTGDIPEDFTAQGLPEARERLRVDSLPEEEKRKYYRELDRRMVEDDVMRSYYLDGRDAGLKDGHKEGLEQGHKEGLEQGLKEGLEQGKKKREIEIARSLKGKVPVEIIIESTGLTAEEIETL